MTIAIPAHWVRHNKTSRVPRRWVYLDTEAHIDRGENVQHQSWRLGVTAFERCDTKKGEWTDAEWRRWDDPVSLWTYVSDLATPRHRTVVLAHNLGYDLRISRALLVLPGLGWRVDLLALGGRTVTVTLRRDKCTLVLCDFASWIPRKLEEIAGMVGMHKEPLPADEASTEEWYRRCTRDVEILRRANREILEWIVRDDLGNWQRTGAGFAYANWRHKHLTDPVLVHNDWEAREAEVAAIGTGRCEAWRHGELPRGVWEEWDLPGAYPRVGLTTRLPTTLVGHDYAPSSKGWRKVDARWRVLYHATVTTEVPTLGVRTDAGWSWPVGTFSGWWWDVELRNAARYGAIVHLHHGIYYQATYALRSWSRWIIPLTEDPARGATPLLAAVTKHMGRALIGRFGAKFPRWDPFAPAEPGELELRGYYDCDSQREGRMLKIAGTTYLSTSESYVADASPALLGAIMAQCRVRLWRCVQTAGPEHVAYMDTDSVIVDRKGAANLRAAVEQGKLWGLRLKARHRDLEVLGPRQLIVGDQGRIAGVARGAERIDHHTFAGERWDGMTTTLQSGTPDVVVIRSATWQVTGQDRRRQHLAGGLTAPLRVEDRALDRPRTA